MDTGYDIDATKKNAPLIRQFLDAMDDALSKKHDPDTPMGKILSELDQLGIGAVCVRGSGLFHLYKRPVEETLLRLPSDIDLTFVRKKGCNSYLGDKLRKTFQAFLSQVATDYDLGFNIENLQRPFVIKCAKDAVGKADYTGISTDGKTHIQIETKIEPCNLYYPPLDKYGQKQQNLSLLESPGMSLSNSIYEITSKLAGLENFPERKKSARMLDMYNVLCVLPKREVSEEEWKNVSKLFSLKSQYFKGTLCSSLQHLDINFSALLKKGHPAHIKEPSAAEHESFYQDLSMFAREGIIARMPTREESDHILDTAFILGVFLGRETKGQARA